MTIILASGSPRRSDLLSRLDIPFEIVPSCVVERAPVPGEKPAEYATALALQKVGDVARRLPGRIVLGADTVVAVDELILGKPADAADAVRMLMLLRGRWHTVITAVASYCGELSHGVVSTEVRMHCVSENELAAYVSSGEPLDKAGAYALQGLGGKLVVTLRGCREAVVGLPLCLVQDLLTDCGLRIPPVTACEHWG